MNIKCLLVDDEPPALKILEHYIESIPNLELAGKCSNAFEAMKVLSEQNVDVMLLDIRMPLLLGTEFLRTLKNPPKVIFTTAHKDYALQGFELEAVDYLLKPISLERFLKAIGKLFIMPVPFPVKEEEGRTGNDFLFFRVDRKMVKVVLEEILFVESLKDYIKIVQRSQKTLLVKQSISSLEVMLPENRFVRIHRSFIVSINKLTAFTNHEVEIGELTIPIGKNYLDRISRLSGI